MMKYYRQTIQVLLLSLLLLPLWAIAYDKIIVNAPWMLDETPQGGTAVLRCNLLSAGCSSLQTQQQTIQIDGDGPHQGQESFTFNGADVNEDANVVCRIDAETGSAGDAKTLTGSNSGCSWGGKLIKQTKGKFGNWANKAGGADQAEEKNTKTDGKFGNWAKTGEKQAGKFGNWAKTGEKQDGKFGNWAKTGEKQDGKFGNWAKAGEKQDGKFGNWARTESSDEQIQIKGMQTVTSDSGQKMTDPPMFDGFIKAVNSFFSDDETLTLASEEAQEKKGGVLTEKQTVPAVNNPNTLASLNDGISETTRERLKGQGVSKEINDFKNKAENPLAGKKMGNGKLGERPDDNGGFGGDAGIPKGFLPKVPSVADNNGSNTLSPTGVKLPGLGKGEVTLPGGFTEKDINDMKNKQLGNLLPGVAGGFGRDLLKSGTDLGKSANSGGLNGLPASSTDVGTAGEFGWFGGIVTSLTQEDKKTIGENTQDIASSGSSVASFFSAAKEGATGSGLGTAASVMKDYAVGTYKGMTGKDASGMGCQSHQCRKNVAKKTKKYDPKKHGSPFNYCGGNTGSSSRETRQCTTDSSVTKKWKDHKKGGVAVATAERLDGTDADNPTTSKQNNRNHTDGWKGTTFDGAKSPKGDEEVETTKSDKSSNSMDFSDEDFSTKKSKTEEESDDKKKNSSKNNSMDFSNSKPFSAKKPSDTSNADDDNNDEDDNDSDDNKGKTSGRTAGGKNSEGVYYVNSLAACEADRSLGGPKCVVRDEDSGCDEKNTMDESCNESSAESDGNENTSSICSPDDPNCTSDTGGISIGTSGNEALATGAKKFLKSRGCGGGKGKTTGDENCLDQEVTAAQIQKARCKDSEIGGKNCDKDGYVTGGVTVDYNKPQADNTVGSDGTRGGN